MKNSSTTDHSLVLLLVLPAVQWRVKAQRRRRHRELRGQFSNPFSSAAARPQPRPPLSEIPPRRPSQPWNMTWLTIKLHILVFWWWRLVICLSGSVSNPDKGRMHFSSRLHTMERRSETKRFENEAFIQPSYLSSFS